MKEGTGDHGEKFFYTLAMGEELPPQRDIAGQIKVAKDLLKMCACGHKKLSHYGKTRLKGCWYADLCRCRRFQNTVAPLVSK